MIPKHNIDISEIKEEVILPTRTYKISNDGKRIVGYTDGIEAMKQAVRLILNTERYENLIYSWDYGVELKNLYGEDTGYVISELKRRITEALTTDVRILDVTDFKFVKSGSDLSVNFVAHTEFGAFEEALNV